jgi:hypothetical protein
MKRKGSDSDLNEQTPVKQTKQAIDEFDEALSLLDAPPPAQPHDEFEEALNLLEEPSVSF